MHLKLEQKRSILKSFKADGFDLDAIKTKLISLDEAKQEAFFEKHSSRLKLAGAEPALAPLSERVASGEVQFIPDEPEPSLAQQAARAGVRQSELAPPSPGGDALLGGILTEATFEQIKRSPKAKEELEALEKESPVAFTVGRAIGFTAGLQGQLFSGLTKATKATKAGQFITRKLGKLLTSVGITAIGTAATEAPRFEGDVAGTTAVATGIAVGIPVVGKLVKGTAKLLNPAFRPLLDSLDDVAAISKKGTQRVIGEVTQKASKILDDVRTFLSQKTKQLSDDVVRSGVGDEIQRLETVIADSSEVLSRAAQGKVAEVRQVLSEVSENVGGELINARRNINQVYGFNQKKIMAEVGSKKIKTLDVANDLIADLQERGLAFADTNNKLKLNLSNPFVEQNKGSLQELVNTIDQLRSDSLTLKQLDLVKQNMGEFADFGVAADRTTSAFRNVWGKIADKIKEVEPRMGTLNKVYSEARVTIDTVSKGLGNNIDTMSSRFEALAAEGKRIGKRSGLASKIEDLGKFSKPAQKEINKAIAQASEVAKLNSLDVVDVKKARTLFKNTLLKGDVIDKKRFKKLEELVGKIDETDQIREALLGVENAPSLSLKNLGSAEGASQAREWVKDFAPQSKDSMEKLIRQAKRMKKLNNIMPELDPGIEAQLGLELSQSEFRSLRLLTRIEPKLAPLFEEGRLAQLIQDNQFNINNVKSIGGIVKILVESPARMAVGLGKLGIHFSGETAFNLFRNISIILSRQEPEVTETEETPAPEAAASPQEQAL